MIRVCYDIVADIIPFSEKILVFSGKAVYAWLNLSVSANRARFST